MLPLNPATLRPTSTERALESSQRPQAGGDDKAGVRPPAHLEPIARARDEQGRRGRNRPRLREFGRKRRAPLADSERRTGKKPSYVPCVHVATRPFQRAHRYDTTFDEKKSESKVNPEPPLRAVLETEDFRSFATRL